MSIFLNNKALMVAAFLQAASMMGGSKAIADEQQPTRTVQELSLEESEAFDGCVAAQWDSPDIITKAHEAAHRFTSGFSLMIATKEMVTRLQLSEDVCAKKLHVRPPQIKLGIFKVTP